MISKNRLSILFVALLTSFALGQTVACSSSVSTGSSETSIWNNILLSKEYGLHRVAALTAGLGLYFYLTYKTPLERFEASKGEAVEAYLYAHVDGQNIRPKAFLKKDKIILAEPYPLQKGGFLPEGTVLRVWDHLDGSPVRGEDILTLIIDSIWDAIEDREDFDGRDDDFMNTLATEVVATLKNLGYSVEVGLEGILIIDGHYKFGLFCSQGYIVGQL